MQLTGKVLRDNRLHSNSLLLPPLPRPTSRPATSKPCLNHAPALPCNFLTYPFCRRARDAFRPWCVAAGSSSFLPFLAMILVPRKPCSHTYNRLGMELPVAQGQPQLQGSCAVDPIPRPHRAFLPKLIRAGSAMFTAAACSRHNNTGMTSSCTDSQCYAPILSPSIASLPLHCLGTAEDNKPTALYQPPHCIAHAVFLHPFSAPIAIRTFFSGRRAISPLALAVPKASDKHNKRQSLSIA